jgi:gluconolactonase
MNHPKKLGGVALKVAQVLLLLCGAALAHAAGPEVAATGLQFPEGTIFVGNNLYFVDYSTSDVLRLVGGKVEKVWHQDGCGANGLIQVPSGLLVACYESGTVVHIGLDGKLEETIRSDDKGLPFLFPNDLAADARGGIYFSASGSESSLGKVYYRSADRRVREVAANIHYSNGVAVSPDGKKLYVAESEASRLLVFDIGPDASLSGQREFVKLADVLGAIPSNANRHEFTPDGVRVDKLGNVFIGLYRGGGFAVVSPQAKLLKYVPLPGAHHANLAISPDGRSVYVTSNDEVGGGGLLVVPNPIGE